MEDGDVGAMVPERGWNHVVVDALRFVRVLLDAGREGMSIEEMQRRSGSSRSTVYRQLVSIREAGWPLRVMHDRSDSRRAYYWLDAS